MVGKQRIPAYKSYKKYFSGDMLKAIYAHSVITRTTVGKDRISGRKLGEVLDAEVELILRKVDACTYSYTDYRQMLFLKREGEPPRVICIPTSRDAIVLSALKMILSDAFGDDIMTPKPQRIIAEIQRCLSESTYDSFIKIDIARFYENISHERLMRCLRRRVRKSQIISLVEKAIRTPCTPLSQAKGKDREKGVPEGLAISNLLANLYLIEIDSHFGSLNTLSYYRYVDDILILCAHDDANQILDEMSKRLKQCGLSINENKREIGQLDQKSFEYLGYVFRADELSIRKSSVHKLERRLEKLVKRYARSSTFDKESVLTILKMTITGCIWREKEESIQRYGWTIYYCQSTDVSCFARLDRLLQEYDKRYSAHLPHDLPRFMRTYFEARFRISKTKYIPTYGYINTQEEKRRMLKALGLDDVGEKDDEWVDFAFTNRMRKICRMLESDVGGGY